MPIAYPINPTLGTQIHEFPKKQYDKIVEIIDAINSGGVRYKTYVANLAQTGTAAPVATVLANTLGGTVVWSRVSQGLYKGTLTGAFPDPTKVVIFGMADGTRLIHAYSDSVNSFLYVTEDNSGVVQDGMTYYSIEVRVYP